MTSVVPSLCHAGPSCLIDDLIVDESARGQGVGLHNQNIARCFLPEI